MLIITMTKTIVLLCDIKDKIIIELNVILCYDNNNKEDTVWDYMELYLRVQAN